MARLARSGSRSCWAAAASAIAEERITQLAREDRERFGPTDAGVRRTWAWPEIVGCVVLVIAFLVWLLAF
ncbi:hypothetical protein GCM10027062_15440 [Nocardioides hungaricus]